MYTTPKATYIQRVMLKHPTKHGYINKKKEKECTHETQMISYALYWYIPNTASASGASHVQPTLRRAQDDGREDQVPHCVCQQCLHVPRHSLPAGDLFCPLGGRPSFSLCVCQQCLPSLRDRLVGLVVKAFA